MMQVVPGSERWTCRVEGCYLFARHNIRYGYCDEHTRRVIHGETLESKFGFPPMAGEPQAPIAEILSSPEGLKGNSAPDPSFSLREEAEPTRDEVAVKLAELMAAHRDGMCSSDCSDINDPGSCSTCETLDSAIKVLSAAESQLTALRQERDAFKKAWEDLSFVTAEETAAKVTAETALAALRVLTVKARRRAPTYGVQEWDWLLGELAAIYDALNSSPTGKGEAG